MKNVEIPSPISTAVIAMLSPYTPGLTPEKLEHSLTFAPENPSDKLLTRKEAASTLRVSLPTIDRMFKDGQLHRVFIRGRVFIRDSEVKSLIKESVRGEAHE
ncbi:MAG: helix-turn-helix domain-containing protein [Kiritimatiellales bacterium]